MANNTNVPPRECKSTLVALLCYTHRRLGIVRFSISIETRYKPMHRLSHPIAFMPRFHTYKVYIRFRNAAKRDANDAHGEQSGWRARAARKREHSEDVRNETPRTHTPLLRNATRRCYRALTIHFRLFRIHNIIDANTHLCGCVVYVYGSRGLPFKRRLYFFFITFYACGDVDPYLPRRL